MRLRLHLQMQYCRTDPKDDSLKRQPFEDASVGGTENSGVVLPAASRLVRLLLYQPPGSIGENVDSQNQIRGGVSSDTFPEILGVPSKQGNH